MTDEMIITLMDAHMNGADFSAAVSSAKIPEGLISEAGDYWASFTRMTAHKAVAPSVDLFENIWSQVEPTSKNAYFAQPEVEVSISTPYTFITSPYLKQLFAVAGALGAMVFVISAAEWAGTTPTQIPSNPVALTRMEAPTADVESPAGARMSVMSTPEATKPSPAPLVPTMQRSMMAKSAAPEPQMAAFSSAPAADSNDPQHLVAVLSETGTREATPDTYIDDNYDQQLAAYDAAMTADNNDTNHAQ